MQMHRVLLTKPLPLLFFLILWLRLWALLIGLGFLLVSSTSFEVLSVILYEFCRPNLQLLRCGSSSTPVFFSIKLSSSSTSVADFVKDFRSNFFDFRSPLLQWIQPPMHPSTTLAASRHQSFISPSFSHRPTPPLLSSKLLIFAFYCCFSCFILVFVVIFFDSCHVVVCFCGYYRSLLCCCGY
jgi:hypothetical protein